MRTEPQITYAPQPAMALLLQVISGVNLQWVFSSACVSQLHLLACGVAGGSHSALHVSAISSFTTCTPVPRSDSSGSYLVVFAPVVPVLHEHSSRHTSRPAEQSLSATHCTPGRRMSDI
jgi:hypothetical protein